jgi:hypothetical protein
MISGLRKRAAASLALLSLVALFFGDFTRGLHLLTARHVLCAVHGDLMEAEGGGEPAALAEGRDPALLPAVPAVDHHEHCSISATPTRTFVSELPGALLVAVAPAVDTLVGITEAQHVDGRAAITYAPKQGPPRGA